MAMSSRRTRRKYRYHATLEKRSDVSDGFRTTWTWETVRMMKCSRKAKRGSEATNGERIVPITVYEFRERVHLIDPPTPDMRIDIAGQKYEIGSVVTSDEPPLEHVMECTAV